MNIGELRHSIIIEQRAQTPDGAGGFTDSWSTFATVFAAVEPSSSKERMFAGKLEGNVSHKITIRYLANLDSSFRIKFGTRIFKIVGTPVNPEERNRWLVIPCEEGAGS